MNSARSSASLGPWREYLIEAGGLGLFMLSASVGALLLEHPASPLRAHLDDAFGRRALMGLGMATTAAGLIYSPWGRRSGAHFNPAVTLTFFLLGKVSRRDLAGYVVAQFVGGAAAMALASQLFRPWLAHDTVNFVVTVPGTAGPLVAFLAEYGIAALLMTVVLEVSNRPRLANFAGLCAAACVALFITFEAPLSGMSLNPARTLASALAAGDARALWVYFAAPPLGMFFAAALHTRSFSRRRSACAKLQHDPRYRCLFCEHQRALAQHSRE